MKKYYRRILYLLIMNREQRLMDLMRFELMAFSLQRRRSAKLSYRPALFIFLLTSFTTRFVNANYKDTMFGNSYIGQIYSIFDLCYVVFSTRTLNHSRVAFWALKPINVNAPLAKKANI